MLTLPVHEPDGSWRTIWSDCGGQVKLLADTHLSRSELEQPTAALQDTLKA